MNTPNGDNSIPHTDSIEQILEGLPVAPGVYLMKDADAKVLYVGKALSLRSRVRSYFRESSDQRFSIKFLRGKVADIEVIVTDTEKEAFLLENTLIKKHKPRYNIRLRDDKTYISLRLDTEHQWPRVHRIRRRRAGDKALYFGPFSSSKSVKETLRFLQRLFPIRSCPDNVLNNRSRPCILHQIGRCSAPCVGLADPEQYARDVEQTILFLRGKRDQVADLLRDKMEEYSEQMAFEKAALVRDRLLAISRTVEKEKVVSHHAFDRDVIGLTRDRGRMMVTVLCFRGGSLSDQLHFDFRDHGQEDAEIMESFLSQYYGDGREIPRDIIVSVEPTLLSTLVGTLQETRGGAVRILAPQRGEKVRLTEMAVRNAKQELDKKLAGERSRDQVLDDLMGKLKLPHPPRRIECFDISNFQGSFVVGSMTCFVDGEPDKGQYRHFKVKTVAGQDDFASMREVLTRRYARQIRENNALPDLIVIDGGKGQLNVAVEVLKELELLGRIPVCGLAKARVRGSKSGVRMQVRTEERVFLPNRKMPIMFDQSDPALFILTRIRDEAHRFGVTYHRKLRSMASLKSGLEELPGIGPKRRVALLKHFGSLMRLRAATAEEIATVEGMPQSLAEELHRYLHSEAAPHSEEETPEENTDGAIDEAPDENADFEF